MSHGTGLFSPSQPRIGSFPNVLQGWLVDLYPSRVVYRKTLDLYREFQFIGNFKVTQYFLMILVLHFQWFEFHIKVHSMARKQCAFSAKRLEKR